MKSLKNVSTPDLERMKSEYQSKSADIQAAIDKGIANQRVLDAFEDTVTAFGRAVADIDAELARRGEVA